MDNEITNLETLPNGKRFLHSVKYPEHGWFVEAETETLPDGRLFLRRTAKPDYGFVVEQRTIEGRQQFVIVEEIQTNVRAKLPETNPASPARNGGCRSHGCTG